MVNTTQNVENKSNAVASGKDVAQPAATGTTETENNEAESAAPRRFLRARQARPQISDNPSTNNQKDAPAQMVQCKLPLDRINDILSKIKKTELSNDNVRSDLSVQEDVNSISPTSLSCELITDAGDYTADGQRRIPRKSGILRLMCLFCDKTFTSTKLIHKHMERYHHISSNRRVSSRNIEQSSTVKFHPGCNFCSKSNSIQTGSNLLILFHHLIEEHESQYFGCKVCNTRFSAKRDLIDHRVAHGNVPMHGGEPTFINLDKFSVDRPNSPLGIENESVKFNNSDDVREHNPKPLKYTANSLSDTNTKEIIVSPDAADSDINDDTSSDRPRRKRRTTRRKVAIKPKPCGVITNPKAMQEKMQRLSGQNREKSKLNDSKSDSNVTPNKKSAEPSISSASTKKISLEHNAVIVLDDINLDNKLSKNKSYSISQIKKTPEAKPPILSRLGIAHNRSLRSRSLRRSRKTPVTENRAFSETPRKDRSKAKGECHDFVINKNKNDPSCKFDPDFYSTVSANVRENLTQHLDGKLGRGESSIVPDIINPKIKSTHAVVESQPAEIHGSDVNLNAITVFPTLLTSDQYGSDKVPHYSYGATAFKKIITKNSWKWKWDPIKKYKYCNEDGKIVRKIRQVQHYSPRDLSKLDIWTQLTMREKYEKSILNEQTTTDSSGDKTIRNERQKQINELNTILDSRSFPNIEKENMRNSQVPDEASTSDAHDSSNPDSINSIIKDDPIPDVVESKFTPERDSSMLNCLGLMPCASTGPPAPVPVLSGEWTRPRCYICCICGRRADCLRLLEAHQASHHPHVNGTHYEIVGQELLDTEVHKYLYLPGTKTLLDKVQKGNSKEEFSARQMKKVAHHPVRQGRSARMLRTTTRSITSMEKGCTKCNKMLSPSEFYKHILECAGDYGWIMAKKKCKYKPFGARRRRVKGLYKREVPQEEEHTETKNNSNRPKLPPRPRTKPSDAETIQRMLANLPAKRASRQAQDSPSPSPKEKDKTQIQSEYKTSPPRRTVRRIRGAIKYEAGRKLTRITRSLSNKEISNGTLTAAANSPAVQQPANQNSTPTKKPPPNDAVSPNTAPAKVVLPKKTPPSTVPTDEGPSDEIIPTAIAAIRAATVSLARACARFTCDELISAATTSTAPINMPPLNRILSMLSDSEADSESDSDDYDYTDVSRLLPLQLKMPSLDEMDLAAEFFASGTDKKILASLEEKKITDYDVKNIYSPTDVAPDRPLLRKGRIIPTYDGRPVDVISNPRFLNCAEVSPMRTRRIIEPRRTRSGADNNNEGRIIEATTSLMVEPGSFPIIEQNISPILRPSASPTPTVRNPLPNIPTQIIEATANITLLNSRITVQPSAQSTTHNDTLPRPMLRARRNRGRSAANESLENEEENDDDYEDADDDDEDENNDDDEEDDESEDDNSEASKTVTDLTSIASPCRKRHKTNSDEKVETLQKKDTAVNVDNNQDKDNLKQDNFWNFDDAKPNDGTDEVKTTDDIDPNAVASLKSSLDIMQKEFEIVKQRIMNSSEMLTCDSNTPSVFPPKDNILTNDNIEKLPTGTELPVKTCSHQNVPYGGYSNLNNGVYNNNLCNNANCNLGRNVPFKNNAAINAAHRNHPNLSETYRRMLLSGNRDFNFMNAEEERVIEPQRSLLNAYYTKSDNIDKPPLYIFGSQEKRPTGQSSIERRISEFDAYPNLNPNIYLQNHVAVNDAIWMNPGEQINSAPVNDPRSNVIIYPNDPRPNAVHSTANDAEIAAAIAAVDDAAAADAAEISEANAEADEEDAGTPDAAAAAKNCMKNKNSKLRRRLNDCIEMLRGKLSEKEPVDPEVPIPPTIPSTNASTPTVTLSLTPQIIQPPNPPATPTQSAAPLPAPAVTPAQIAPAQMTQLPIPSVIPSPIPQVTQSPNPLLTPSPIPSVIPPQIPPAIPSSIIYNSIYNNPADLPQPLDLSGKMPQPEDLSMKSTSSSSKNTSPSTTLPTAVIKNNTVPNKPLEKPIYDQILKIPQFSVNQNNQQISQVTNLSNVPSSPRIIPDLPKKVKCDFSIPSLLSPDKNISGKLLKDYQPHNNPVEYNQIRPQYPVLSSKVPINTVDNVTFINQELPSTMPPQIEANKNETYQFVTPKPVEKIIAKPETRSGKHFIEDILNSHKRNSADVNQSTQTTTANVSQLPEKSDSIITSSSGIPIETSQPVVSHSNTENDEKEAKCPPEFCNVNTDLFLIDPVTGMIIERGNNEVAEEPVDIDVNTVTTMKTEKSRTAAKKDSVNFEIVSSTNVASTDSADTSSSIENEASHQIDAISETKDSLEEKSSDLLKQSPEKAMSKLKTGQIKSTKEKFIEKSKSEDEINDIIDDQRNDISHSNVKTTVSDESKKNIESKDAPPSPVKCPEHPIQQNKISSTQLTIEDKNSNIITPPIVEKVEDAIPELIADAVANNIPADNSIETKLGARKKEATPVFYFGKNNNSNCSSEFGKKINTRGNAKQFFEHYDDSNVDQKLGLFHNSETSDIQEKQPKPQHNKLQEAVDEHPNESAVASKKVIPFKTKVPDKITGECNDKVIINESEFALTPTNSRELMTNEKIAKCDKSDMEIKDETVPKGFSKKNKTKTKVKDADGKKITLSQIENDNYANAAITPGDLHRLGKKHKNSRLNNRKCKLNNAIKGKTEESDDDICLADMAKKKSENIRLTLHNDVHNEIPVKNTNIVAEHHRTGCDFLLFMDGEMFDPLFEELTGEPSPPRPPLPRLSYLLPEENDGVAPVEDVTQNTAKKSHLKKESKSKGIFGNKVRSKIRGKKSKKYISNEIVSIMKDDTTPETVQEVVIDVDPPSCPKIKIRKTRSASKKKSFSKKYATLRKSGRLSYKKEFGEEVITPINSVKLSENGHLIFKKQHSENENLTTTDEQPLINHEDKKKSTFNAEIDPNTSEKAAKISVKDTVLEMDTTNKTPIVDKKGKTEKPIVPETDKSKVSSENKTDLSGETNNSQTDIENTFSEEATPNEITDEAVKTEDKLIVPDNLQNLDNLDNESNQNEIQIDTDTENPKISTTEPVLKKNKSNKAHRQKVKPSKLVNAKNTVPTITVHEIGDNIPPLMPNSEAVIRRRGNSKPINRDKPLDGPKEVYENFTMKKIYMKKNKRVKKNAENNSTPPPEPEEIVEPPLSSVAVQDEIPIDESQPIVKTHSDQSESIVPETFLDNIDENIPLNKVCELYKKRQSETLPSDKEDEIVDVVDKEATDKKVEGKRIKKTRAVQNCIKKPENINQLPSKIRRKKVSSNQTTVEDNISIVLPIVYSPSHTQSSCDESNKVETTKTESIKTPENDFKLVIKKQSGSSKVKIVKRKNNLENDIATKHDVPTDKYDPIENSVVNTEEDQPRFDPTQVYDKADLVRLVTKPCRAQRKAHSTKSKAAQRYQDNESDNTDSSYTTNVPKGRKSAKIAKYDIEDTTWLDTFDPDTYMQGDDITSDVIITHKLTPKTLNTEVNLEAKAENFISPDNKKKNKKAQYDKPCNLQINKKLDLDLPICNMENDHSESFDDIMLQPFEDPNVTIDHAAIFKSSEENTKKSRKKGKAKGTNDCKLNDIGEKKKGKNKTAKADKELDSMHNVQPDGNNQYDDNIFLDKSNESFDVPIFNLKTRCNKNDSICESNESLNDIQNSDIFSYTGIDLDTDLTKNDVIIEPIVTKSSEKRKSRKNNSENLVKSNKKNDVLADLKDIQIEETLNAIPVTNLDADDIELDKIHNDLYPLSNANIIEEIKPVKTKKNKKNKKGNDNIISNEIKTDEITEEIGPVIDTLSDKKINDSFSSEVVKKSKKDKLKLKTHHVEEEVDTSPLASDKIITEEIDNDKLNPENKKLSTKSKKKKSNRKTLENDAAAEICAVPEIIQENMNVNADVPQLITEKIKKKSSKNIQSNKAEDKEINIDEKSIETVNSIDTKISTESIIDEIVMSPERKTKQTTLISENEPKLKKKDKSLHKNKLQPKEPIVEKIKNDIPIPKSDQPEANASIVQDDLPINNDGNLENDADKEYRLQDKYLADFGMYTEKRPRKSTILAIKKISQTFKPDSSDTDEMIDKVDRTRQHIKPQKKRPKKHHGPEDFSTDRPLVPSNLTIAPVTTIQEEIPETPPIIVEDPEVPMITSIVQTEKPVIFASPKSKPPRSDTYCAICKRKFRRPENLLKHNATLTHISKLSEIEAIAIKKRSHLSRNLKMKMNQESEMANKSPQNMSDNKTSMEKPYSDSSHLRPYKNLAERKSFDNEATQILSTPVCVPPVACPPLYDIELAKISSKMLIDQTTLEIEKEMAGKKLSRDEALFFECCSLLKESETTRKSVRDEDLFKNSQKVLSDDSVENKEKKSVVTYNLTDIPVNPHPYINELQNNFLENSYIPASSESTNVVDIHSLHNSIMDTSSVEPMEEPEITTEVSTFFNQTYSEKPSEVIDNGSDIDDLSQPSDMIDNTVSLARGDVDDITEINAYSESVIVRSNSNDFSDNGDSTISSKDNVPKRYEHKDVDKYSRKKISTAIDVRIESSEEEVDKSAYAHNLLPKKPIETSNVLNATYSRNDIEAASTSTGKKAFDFQPSDISSQFIEFEDKFDKIKRKAREKAQAAQEAMAAAVMSPTVHSKNRKKSHSKAKKSNKSGSEQSSKSAMKVSSKSRRISKKKLHMKDQQKSSSKKILTKGALKGFDSVKIPMPSQINPKPTDNTRSNLQELVKYALQVENVMLDEASCSVQNDSHNYNKKIPSKKSDKKSSSSSQKSSKKLTYNTNYHSVTDTSSMQDFDDQQNLDIYEFFDDEDNSNVKSDFKFSSPSNNFNEKYSSPANKRSENQTGNNMKNTLEAHNEDSQISSLSFSDRDDFNYMSDDYRENRSEDETNLSSNSVEPTAYISKFNIRKNKMLRNRKMTKKSAIMGRIFKNNAIRNDQKVSSENSNDVNSKDASYCNRTNMDQLFDSLLEKTSSSMRGSSKLVEKSYEPAELTDYCSTQEETNCAPPNDSHKTPDRDSPTDYDSDDMDDDKSIMPARSNQRKIIPRLKARSSDDESSLNPSILKGISDNVLHGKRQNKSMLSERYHDGVGVANRKSQRKCTTGKQNVLVESWSSESDYEDFRQFEEYSSIPKTQRHHRRPRRSRRHHLMGEHKMSADNSDPKEDASGINALYEQQFNESYPSGQTYTDVYGKVVVDDDDDDDFSNYKDYKMPEMKDFLKKDSDIEEDNFEGTSHGNPHLKARQQLYVRRRVSFNNPNNLKSSQSSRRRRKQSQKPFDYDDEFKPTRIAEPPSAQRRNKRSASEMLYYWSSSSDDEMLNVAADSSSREPEPIEQHGWIVGDSHKKLVTMLAHAKGRKSDDTAVVKEKKTRLQT